jgi:phospholipase/lecithinase/hemolysin
MLHIPNSGHPSLRTPGVFTDYAVGDARGRAGAGSFPYFDLTTQVDDFLADFGGKAPANTLFVIWIGADDLEDALNALSADPSGATSLVILEDAIAAIETNIGRLYAAGGRMFLIADVPDLANTPYVRYLGANVDPAIPVIASEFTNGFDVELDAVTGGLAGLPGMQYFRFFDVNALFSEVLAAPGKFKLSNVTDRCTIPNVTGRAMCADPDAYLFWDGTHPTTAAHGIVAAAALSILPPQ